MLVWCFEESLIKYKIVEKDKIFRSNFIRVNAIGVGKIIFIVQQLTLNFYCVIIGTREKRNKGENKKMTKAKTVVAVYIDSLNEIDINGSRDRKNLLFCVMQN